MRGKMKVVLIGCGRIALRHATILSNQDKHEFELCAVSDLDETKRKTFAASFGIDTFSCYREMIKTVKPDLVAVLTESGSHYEITNDLITFKLPVLVEKPLTLRLDHAIQLITDYEQAGIPLYVVKQNRFNKPVAHLKSLIENHQIGKAFSASARVRWCRNQGYYDQDDWRGTWLQDGGALTNQASHHIDLLTWLNGPIKSVYALSATYGVNIEAEDTLVACLQFSNGSIGTFEVTTAVRPTDLEGSVSYLTDKASIEIGGFAVNKLTTYNVVERRALPSEMETFSENPPNVYGFGHQKLYEHLNQVMKFGEKSQIDARSSLHSLNVIHAIYKSIEINRPINVNLDVSSQYLGQQNGGN